MRLFGPVCLFTFWKVSTLSSNYGLCYYSGHKSMYLPKIPLNGKGRGQRGKKRQFLYTSSIIFSRRMLQRNPKNWRLVLWRVSFPFDWTLVRFWNWILAYSFSYSSETLWKMNKYVQSGIFKAQSEKWLEENFNTNKSQRGKIKIKLCNVFNLKHIYTGCSTVPPISIKYER